MLINEIHYENSFNDNKKDRLKFRTESSGGQEQFLRDFVVTECQYISRQAIEVFNKGSRVVKNRVSPSGSQ